MISAIDHNAAALARVAQYLRGKPKFAALLASFTRGHDQLEAALRQVLDDTTLDTAVGVQLDQLGEIVGLGRQGITDDEIYRTMIKAQIKVNRSSGTISDIVHIFELVAAVAPASPTTHYLYAAADSVQTVAAGAEVTDGTNLYTLDADVEIDEAIPDYPFGTPSYETGDMVRGASGDLFLCTVSGTAGGMGPIGGSVGDLVVSGTATFLKLTSFVAAGYRVPEADSEALSVSATATVPGATGAAPALLTLTTAPGYTYAIAPFSTDAGADETPTTVEEHEEPPAGFVVRLLDVPQDPDLIPFFATFLRQARAAGVRGLLEWAESPSGDMFRFDSGPGFDQGHLAGAID